MLLGKSDNILGHSREMMRRNTERHLAAYQPCDIEILMNSTSPRGGIWAGFIPPDIAVIAQEPAEIRQTYLGLIDAMEVRPSEFLTLICSDWYGFFESFGTTLNRKSGEVYEGRAVCIFATDEIGLNVDMAWPFLPGTVREDVGWRQKTVDLTAHNKRMAALRDEDFKTASLNVAEKCHLFLPCFDPADQRRALSVSSRAEYEAYLEKLFSRYKIESIAPSNISVSNQYVFSETLWHVRERNSGKPQVIRYALAEIFNPEGDIGSMLGLATLTDA
jgi:hypothetical protein